MVETTAKMETETTIEMKEMMEMMMETMDSDSDTSVSSTSTPDEPRRRKRKAVTFAAVEELCQTFTYDGVGAEEPTTATSPAKRTNARVVTTGRRATPYRKGQSSWTGLRSPAPPSSALKARSSPQAKKQRLVETGAVRVKISQHPNPRRRGVGGGHDERLVATGAVRIHVTRHTTPRRLNAVGRRIWSPPPPSTAERRRPRSEVVYRTGRAEPGGGGKTPPSSGWRRNGLTGGHRFRAAMSPPPKSAAAKLSRTLF